MLLNEMYFVDNVQYSSLVACTSIFWKRKENVLRWFDCVGYNRLQAMWIKKVKANLFRHEWSYCLQPDQDEYATVWHELNKSKKNELEWIKSPTKSITGTRANLMKAT